MTTTTTAPSSPPDIAPKARQPYGWVKWLFGTGLILAVVMSGAGYLVGRTMRPYEMRGLQLEPPIAAANFSMISSRTGQPVSLADFQGQFVLLYFGYATCPDVCPTSLSRYSQSYAMLSPEAQEHIKFLWITVDPQRDTPEVMETYIDHFAPEFMLGLIPGSQEELTQTARAYGAHFERVDVGSASSYLMEHSTSAMLIDPQGQWRMVYAFETPAEDVAADLEYLIETEIQSSH